MINKEYCMSSYLTFRYVVRDDMDFFDSTSHQIYRLIPDDKRILVSDENEVDYALETQFATIREKKIGILLSGGMDSACLASYMAGADAYTFRFLGGEYQKEELARAEYYANRYNLRLHYVDIDWNAIQGRLNQVMQNKGAPVHSIEPQIMVAAEQAAQDGIEQMIIGDAADYVFGGMDGLLSKDWKYDEFIKRYTYVDPATVLKEPVSMNEAFEKYRVGDGIDYQALMHEYTDIESFASYKNAFDTAKMPFLDPYEVLKMAQPLDLQKVRNGNSKYIIRALFRKKYPEFPVPQKLPMPRPVDEYFKTWKGPTRPEFRNDMNITKFSGNQKWLIYCLERFLTIFEL